MYKMVNGVTIKMTDEEIAEFNANLPTEAEILARKMGKYKNAKRRKTSCNRLES